MVSKRELGDPKNWYNRKTKQSRLIKIEEDGSKTTAQVLQIGDKAKLHCWEGPALVNEKQRKKEYYLNGIMFTKDEWKEIKKGREGLPWYKNPAHKGTSRH